MAAEVLKPIDCSVQPLDIAFHPTKNILAAALVDGTVEFHDFTSRFTPPTASTHAKASRSIDDDDDEEEEDEDDTILSSIHVHSSDIPKYKLKSTSTSPNKSTSTSTSSKLSPSCRALLFNTTGTNLYTAGNGGTLACLDVEHASSYHTSDASLMWRMDDASPHGINVLHLLGDDSPTGPLLVSGDDEGVVRLWDVRLCGGGNGGNGAASSRTSTSTSKTTFDGLLDLPQGCIASFHENTDYITGFGVDESGNTLLASSADATITAIDLRKNSQIIQKEREKQKQKQKKSLQNKSIVKSGPFRILGRSDDQEDELLSLCLIKGGRKVICGTQNGVLNVWSWGTWGDISDRFPGHPQSIDALLKIDEDTILTGSSDGVVRIVQIHPDRMLGVLGDNDGFPVEKLRFSSGRKLVGSVSHDTLIRLWDASILTEEDIDEDDGKGDSSMEDTDEVSNAEFAGTSASAAVAARLKNGSDDEWEDMDDSDDSMDKDSDDSDDSEDEMEEKKPKFKTVNEQFFSDL